MDSGITDRRKWIEMRVDKPVADISHGKKNNSKTDYK